MFNTDKTKHSIFLFMLASLIATGILAGCTGNTSPIVTTTPTPISRSSIPVVPITAIDYGYSMPASISVRAGLVDIALVNNGTETHQAQVARLNQGVTRDQVVNELVTKKQQAAAFALLTFVGGPDSISPGYGQEAILNLSAGSYVLLCFVVGSDGIPHVNKGMIHFFNVDSALSQGTPPQVDGEVMIHDSGYTLPAIIKQARAITLHVTNQGSQPHEFTIVKLAKGKSTQDIIAFFQSPSGPPPFEETGGMATLAANGSGWIKMHLDAGNYAAFSFIPDAKTGQPQLTEGLLTPFTVQ